jgi:FkbM family methyltransferase
MIPAPDEDAPEGFNQLVQTRYGPMLYNRNDQYVGASLAAYGEFSEGEAAMFRQLVTAGDTVVEAGANIGAHTLHLSRLAGEQGVIYAFEPQRIVFQTLCANLALNQRVNVIARQQGLGRQGGEMALPEVDPRHANNFGGLSLLPDGKGERVVIATIDSLQLTRCRLIKADVEGMEEAAIAGAANTIAHCRPILYLENDRREKSASLIRLLQSLGYRSWWHLTPLFNPENFAKNSVNIFGSIVSINILCQPTESARPVSGLREIANAEETWNLSA